jgi:hypothetical protein
MARGEEKKAGDPLKSYTIVMTLLVLVMAVLYFMIDGKRKDYALANAKLRTALTGEGLRARDIGDDLDRPRTIPDLAYAVEGLAKTAEEASGGEGLRGHISNDMMDRVAARAQLRQIGGGAERLDPHGKYETVTKTFDYESLAGGPPALPNLLTLLYDIEVGGRYRVSRVTWEVAEPTDQPTDGPRYLIKKPRIEVSLRGPRLE